MKTDNWSCKHFSKSHASVMSEERGGKVEENEWRVEWKDDAKKTQTCRKLRSRNIEIVSRVEEKPEDSNGRQGICTVKKELSAEKNIKGTERKVKLICLERLQLIKRLYSATLYQHYQKVVINVSLSDESLITVACWAKKQAQEGER